MSFDPVPAEWMSRPGLMPKFLICMLWISVHGTPFRGAFYHLAAPSYPCRVTSQENDTLDIICRYNERSVTTAPPGTGRSCLPQNVVWQRADYHFANITDDTKYGVWDAVPGWMMAERQRISLLRVRHLQSEDMGLYQCRVQCLSDDGRVHVTEHMVDLCVQEKPGYAICAATATYNRCSRMFANGICNPECDNEENLYDGFDCSFPLPDCLRINEEKCRQGFANGACDSECDSSACAWDGGDCIDKPLVFASDKIVLTLASWYYRSGQVVDIKDLGRILSKLLRTIVRVMPNDWPGSHKQGRDVTWHRPDRRDYGSVRKIYLKIDNTMCHRQCFHTAEYAARFLDLSLRNDWDPGIPITAIGVLSKTVNKCDLENNTLLHLDLPISKYENTNPNIYSYSYAESSDSSLPPTWLLVTASIGGVLIIALVAVIIIIILRIRKLNKEERRRAVADINRIQDKNMAQGTNV